MSTTPEQPTGLKFSVEAHLDINAQTLTFETTDFSGKIACEVYSFKELAVRRSLIALGWTPPPTLAACQPSPQLPVEPCAHTVGEYQFEGDTYCRRCNAVMP